MIDLNRIDLGRRELTGMDSADREWMRSYENRLMMALYISYLEARKGGKRKTHDEHIFEVNAMENLRLLHRDIMQKTYRPSRSTAHIIYNPVIREIFAAPFRDRVVHHLLFEAVSDWWDRRFIYDSYSCRKGKGTLFGIQRLDHHIRVVSQNYARPAWILKLDVQGYFMSLPRRELYARAVWGLERQFAERLDSREYEMLKFLWWQTIFDDPVKGVHKKGDLAAWGDLPPSKSLFCQPPGKGIVIGNLTSQLLSNVYLDQLDRFVTMDLGYKHYGRYVDDFYIVVNENELPQLKKDVMAIENYLQCKQLTLHPHKRSLQEMHRGVDFLGAVVYPGRIVPGARLVRNCGKALREVAEGRRSVDTVASYMGHVKYMKGISLLRRSFDWAGWEYQA